MLAGGKVKTVSVELSTPARLVPVHIKNRPPSYFIFAGLVFTQARRAARHLVHGAVRGAAGATRSKPLRDHEWGCNRPCRRQRCHAR